MRNPLPSAGARLSVSKRTWSLALSRATTERRVLFPRLPISPSRILALRLRSKDPYRKKTYRSAFNVGASVRSGRLPLLTLQKLLAKQDLSEEERLAKAVSARTEAEWTDSLNNLATRGWPADRLDHWVWILSAENGDERVQRLISTDDPKPIYILLLLLRRDEVFRKFESIRRLVGYIGKNHIASHPRSLNVGVSASATGHRRTLTVSQFLILIRRLAHHIRIAWPRTIVTVARLTVDYIKSIPNDPFHKRLSIDPYSAQCQVFNAAIQYLTTPAPNHPVANMEFNWRSQRVLLTMSDNLTRPLIINKASYQAIRQVLVGLRKSHAEKVFALRYAKTWPPYRQDFDAGDTKRTVEDDRSRSVKAGVLMKEAGYPENDFDRALDALGGTSESSPTIQTRSLPPRQENGNQEESNIYLSWAMRIRATRNAQEAWRVFNSVAQKSELPPNVNIYNEMFLKLLAAPVDLESNPDLLPGDSRETFPVHNANYSQYELARLSPPTVPELYTEMMNRGIKPRGIGLLNLVSNARSVDEGLRYLTDSGIPSHVIEEIASSKAPSHQTLQSIPLLCFKSYIQLLCKLQPDYRAREEFTAEELYRVRHAINLVTIRLHPNSTAGATFRPPWHLILRALARSHIAIINGSMVENDLESLMLFITTFNSARKCIGIDAELFILLCRVIQKAALSRLISLPSGEYAEAPLIPWKPQLLRQITSDFSKLTTPFEEESGADLAAKFQYPITPPHLHAYMRALAFLDAKDEMVKLLFWMFDNYKYVRDEANRLPTRGHAMVAKTFCAFRALADLGLDEAERQQLNSRMDQLIASGEPWRWPTPDEVDSYIRNDKSGGTEALRRRILENLHLDSWRSERQAEAAGI
ncbi:hypothetical protein F4861DRAFT_450804 [Xylaria intraflava]|nr:hypothetical protein F4861DRAFT_450804 [Xylaria intraflava]